MMDTTEHLKYQLQELQGYTPEDLDYPDFEVAYEDEQGREGYTTICCIDLGKRSLGLIKELEAEVCSLKESIEANKEMIFHISHKLNAVVGLNQQELDWLKTLGAEVE